MHDCDDIPPSTKLLLPVVSAVVFGMLFGAAIQWLVSKTLEQSHERVVAKLWCRFAAYQAHMHDPKNREKDLTQDLTFVRPPFDLEPILSQLAAEGEVDHLDLVFPTVPYEPEYTRHWMTFSHEHPEIIEATGNPNYANFRVTGPAPLHLHLWVKKGNDDLIRRLIRELEEMAAAKKAATP